MESMKVSTEVQFAQKLASNEKKIRDRAIKRLQKYMSVRSNNKVGLSDSDFLKIWKGLYYCMWMQDKPLIQEELSQRITKLLSCFQRTHDALRFTKVFLETLAREWNGIDRLRLDKFMMMVRDMLHATFTLMSHADWPENECQEFATAMSQHVMQPDKPELPDGLKLHLSDIFIEEIWKVPLTQMTSKKLVILLKPFIDFVMHSNKIELVRRIMADVIYKAINTMSGKHSDADRVEDNGENENQETEMMDVDESEQEQQSFRLDLSLLLVVMFKLAQGKDIRAPNRAIAYKLVKKHSEIYGNIVNSLTSSELTDKDFELDLHFLQDDGKAKDQATADKRKKKRRKKKNPQNELNDEENMEDGALLCDESESGGALTSTKTASSKQTLSKNKITRSALDSVKLNKQLSSGSQKGDSMITVEETESPEKIETKVASENRGGVDQVNINSIEQDTGIHKVTKKRKHREEEISSQPAKKRKKFSDLHGDIVCGDSSVDITQLESETLSSEREKGVKSPVSETQFQAKEGQKKSSKKSSKNEDANNNARAKAQSASPKQVPVATPVEFVMYPSQSNQSYSVVRFKSIRDSSSSPKRSRKKGSPAEMDGGPGFSHKSLPIEMADDEMGSQFTNGTSLSKGTLLTDSPLRGTFGEEAGPRKQEHAEMPATTNIVGDICSALKAPCNVMKKALAMVRSSPTETNTESAKTSSQAVTPNTKKKVIFDLRKNKANKFQDYIKSLTQQPEPPFEPTKSPSVGILKSPAVSPLLSPTASETSNSSFDDSLTSTPSVSETKGQKKKKSRSVSGCFSRSPNRTDHKSRKKSISPQKRRSQSPSPSTSKSKGKIKGKTRK